jgi:predicted DNA-binding transcriptional regulator AlpA
MTIRRRIKIAELERRLGVHKQTIWRWYSFGDFPKPHYLSQDRMWFESEVSEWEARKMAERTAEKGAA